MRRYGPYVQAAGIHHNPTPGPAGSPRVYGHVFVVLALLVEHRSWGVIALPLLSRLYVRRKNLPSIASVSRPSHADKRRAWRREFLLGEILALLRSGPTAAEIQAAADSLLRLAA